ncbi:Tetraspanin-1 [Paragonimus heterotremus]|uniref:Tetraspanin n=1 Tax=Paragonimus heterotremus TaxID=100268 RepID=A0A8J4TMU5_9TREM|nr:Tetraspanin-1 [Paragonimus heterotremus]
MACCFIFSKICLFFLNFLFVLIGLLTVALGIWVVVDDQSFFETVAFFSKTQSTALQLYGDTELVRVCAWVLIAIGALVFILSFCGCWGVVSESRCLLIVYATLMSFIVLVEVVCVILLFALMSVWQPQLVSALSNTFSKTYVGTMGAFEVSGYEPFSLAMDAFMVQFECCGINGSTDFETAKTAEAWFARGRTFKTPSQTYIGDQVKLPTACCKFTSKTFFMDQKYSEFLGNMMNQRCPLSPPADYHLQPCKDVIPAQMDKHKVPLIVIPVVVLVLELICIGVAIYLAVMIKRWDDELYY